MNKFFWIPLITSFGTIILLYTIGFIADLSIFAFEFSLASINISLLPIAIGILAGFVAERILKLKAQN